MLSRLIVAAAAVLVLVAAADSLRGIGEPQEGQPPPAAADPGAPPEPRTPVLLPPAECRPRAPRRDDPAVVVVECDHWTGYGDLQVLRAADAPLPRP